MPVLPRLTNYDDIYRQFRWQVPARYNIGVDVCDRWAQAEPGRLAILHVRPDGGEDAISYGALRETSNRLANVLRAHGVARGDRVAILLPQAPEVAAAHIAIYKLGAIALPLAVLFGIDALRYRLQNSGATALIANAQGVARIAEISKDLPDLKLVLSLDGAGDGALDFAAALARAASDFTAVDTAADDPATWRGLIALKLRPRRPARGPLPSARERQSTPDRVLVGRAQDGGASFLRVVMVGIVVGDHVAGDDLRPGRLGEAQVDSYRRGGVVGGLSRTEIAVGQHRIDHPREPMRGKRGQVHGQGVALRLGNLCRDVADQEAWRIGLSTTPRECLGRGAPAGGSCTGCRAQ